MTDRSRATAVLWAALCLGPFALLTALVAGGWAPLFEADDALGEPLSDLTHGWVTSALRVVEVGTGTIAVALATLVVAGLLFSRGHVRAAAYAVGVVAVSMALTHLLKAALGRPRPERQAEFAELATGAFPSGHAAYAAALGGVLLVVSSMLLRRAGLRRLVAAVVVALALLVCADRLLLARHWPSDVVGGLLLGAGVVLLGLAVWSPQPRSIAATETPIVSSVPAPTRELHVILNPVKVEDVGQFKAIVTGMAKEAGWSTPVWHLTAVEDSGTGMAHDASVAGADLVLVCGGDGTVREVCAELAGTGIPVGIVPAGTGNLLARNLAIPLYLRSAIDVALNGQDRAVDLVEVSGDDFEQSHFLVMAGMGFDAAIMEGVNEDIKKRVGWLAYVLSALKSLMFPVMKVEISVDGGEFTRHRARTVVVGNVGYLQAGMPLLPDAAIDDGTIDVVIIHPQRFLSWLPIVWRVLAKRPRTDETLGRMTGRTVTIRTSGPVPRQLDGDSIGPGRELTMTCLHGKLLVRSPR